MYCLSIKERKHRVGIVLQTSPESPGIFLLLQKLFAAQSVTELKEVAVKQGFSDEEWQVRMDHYPLS